MKVCAFPSSWSEARVRGYSDGSSTVPAQLQVWLEVDDVSQETCFHLSCTTEELSCLGVSILIFLQWMPEDFPIRPWYSQYGYLSICPSFFVCFVGFFYIKCQFGQGMHSWKELTNLWSPGLALFHRQLPQECCPLFCEQWHWHKEEQFFCHQQPTCLKRANGWVPSLAARLCFFSFPPCKYSLSLLVWL